MIRIANSCRYIAVFRIRKTNEFAHLGFNTLTAKIKKYITMKLIMRFYLRILKLCCYMYENKGKRISS